MGRVVQLADVALEIVVPDGPMPPGLTLLLEQLPPAETPSQASIVHAIEGPPVPDRSPDVELERLRLWIDEPDVHVLDATGVTARLTETQATIGGGDERAANGFHALLLFALTHLLAGHDRYVLHGGGVVRDGRALLVLGGSGAGKSTLVVAAAESGWGLLADDMVVLRRSDDGLEATGVPRAVLVPGDMGWTVATRTNPLDPRERRFVEIDLAHGWFPVAGTIIVSHAESAEGVLAPLAAHAVLSKVLASYVATMNPPLLRRFLPTAAALSRVPGWSLELGRKPDLRRAAAVRMLTAAAGPAL